MTALKQYDRLEAYGLWRSDPDAQLREVLLSFGETSLVIRDRNEAPLTHWSLPAIVRINPGEMPALFEPGPGSGEVLEIEDELMVDAIETVRAAIDRARPRSGRLRLLVLLAVTACIAALGWVWLPNALISHTLNVVPEAKRAQIGRDILAEITRRVGPPCDNGLGLRALSQLRARVAEGDPIRATYVIPADIGGGAILPGGMILLQRDLFDAYDTPEVAAGQMLVLLENLKNGTDPLRPVLIDAGLGATFHLLTTGELDTGATSDQADRILDRSGLTKPNDSILGAFKDARVASTPFAFAIDSTGETTLSLIEADPMSGQTTAALLSDSDWISLKAICEN